MSAVVSDASPLHYLIECGAANALERLFGEVIIPPSVFSELQHERTPAIVREWVLKHPGWIRLQVPSSVDESMNVDVGEREAISLALEIGAPVVLMDDRRARREATRRGLRVVGTIGLLEASARRGLLDFEEAVRRLRGTRARLDEDLIKAARMRLVQP